MTSEIEDAHIHNLLAELLANYGRANYFIFLKSMAILATEQQVLILDRVKAMQLVSSSVDDPLYIDLTPHGIDVARHPEGYLGHKKEEREQRAQQQRAQAEKEELDRAAALATVSSAESAVSAARAAWVAAIFSLVSIAISVVTLLQPDKTEQLQSQLTSLQQQLALLKGQVATQNQLLDEKRQLQRQSAPAVLPKSTLLNQHPSRRN